MSEEQDSAEYAAEIESYKSYLELEAEQKRLHNLISQSKRNVDVIFKSVGDLPALIAEEINSMKETKVWMEYSEKPQNMKKTYDETVATHAQELRTQKNKLDGSGCRITPADERGSGSVRKTLNDLTVISKIEEEHKALEAELALLNEIQSTEQASIDAILQDNAALSDELVALHSETGLRKAQLVPLQAQFDELAAKYADEECPFRT